MNKDKYVFAQLIGFLDNNKFRHLVDKYDGNRYVKHFTCWNRAYVPLYDGRALRLHAVEEVVGRHLPPAPPQRAPLAVGRLRHLSAAFPHVSHLRAFLCPHQHRLLQAKAVHVVALLAVLLHRYHEAAAFRIYPQPYVLLQP